MNTNLTYKGLVKVFLNINGKTIEVTENNSGTQILLESICRFLAGEYRGDIDIPKYLDIRTQGLTPTSMLRELIPLTGRSYIVDNTGTYARCDCSILYSYLINSISADSGTDYDLILCADPEPNTSTYRDLAIVSVPSLSLSRIVAGTSAVVEWKLYIQNGSD